MASDIVNEDRVLLRRFLEQHNEILRKFDEAQKKAMGDYEESLQDGYQSQYCNGVLRGMRIVRELLAVLEHNRGLPMVDSWQDQNPSEATLLQKANVTCEAVHKIAEACAAAICDGHSIECWRSISKHYAKHVKLTQEEVTGLLAKTLDAIHEAGSRCS